MADNYVTLKIRATDDAKPDLDDLKLKLDELGHKVDTAQVKVDDEDAKLKLLDMNAKLAELNKKVASPKISLAGAARAQFEAEALSAKLDELKAKSDAEGSGGGRFGAIGRMLFGVGGGDGSGIMSALGSIASSPAGLAGIAAAVGALLVEATGLVSGFAAAGAGVGAFAALALPAFDAVKGALKDTSAQLAKLSPDERGAVEGIRSLKDEFMKMSNAFQPAAFKVFNDLLRVANTLLPHLKPFADAAAGALDGLLKKVDKFAGSTGFKDWLKQFEKLAGPSITAIGTGIGQVTIAIGKLLTTMSKKDVINAINIAFTVLADTIKVVTGYIKFMMENWDNIVKGFNRAKPVVESAAHDIAHAFDTIRHAAATMAHDVAAHFDEIRHDAANMAHNLASYFDEIRGNIHSWESDVANIISEVAHWFERLPARVKSALSDLAGILRTIGVNAIMGLVHGIESMAGAVESAVKHIAGLIPSALSHILSIFSPSRVTFWHGQMLGQGLIDGMDSMHGKVAAAAARMGRSAGLGNGSGGTFGGGGMAGGGGTLRLEFTGGDGEISEALVKFMRNYIRVTGGGNVQQALGRG